MQSFDEQGFQLVSDFLAHDVLEKIIGDLNAIELAAGQGGIRNIESRFTSIRNLVNSNYLKSQAAPYLKGNSIFVRAIYFNKTANNNWLVPWHQDKTIAVSEKLDLLGWQAWSNKNGQLYVQPPASVLNDMVTLRINLDDVTRENGCLKVIPGSHKQGILTQHQIAELLAKSGITYCEASRGSALVMKPLIVHASSKAMIPNHRRVLHLEYSSSQLPSPLQWASAV